MRRRTRIAVAALATAALLIAAVPPATAVPEAEPAAVVIDPGIRSPAFGGWGTSLAWFANHTGSWRNRAELADRLFGTTNTDTAPSLMLNLARYDIGGGNDPARVSTMRTGAAVPGYKPTETGGYDWTADANQRWWLSAAQARVPASQLAVDAVAYSAPYWLTRSGRSTGALSKADDNLRVGGEAAYADYLTEVVKHFRDDWGTTFRTLAPLNEASTKHWGADVAQEGMNVSAGAPQKRVLDAVHSALRTKGLPTGLAAADETGIADTRAGIRALVAAGFDMSRLARVNTHAYQPGDRAALHQQVAGSANLPLTMSEVTVSAGPHDPQAMASGLLLSDTISQDLTLLQAQEWVYWQALESGPIAVKENGNWGLMQYSEDGSETYSITKKFHVMRQYTNFIRPGAIVLSSSDAKTVSAYDPATGSLSIVVRNDATTSAPYSVDLTRFASTGSASVYRTSATENRATLASVPTADRALSTSLTPQSVTTFVLPVTGGLTNAIQNPGLDAGVAGQNIPGWLTWGGDAAGTHLDADYTQAGGHGGGGLEGVHFRPVPYSVYTWQTAEVSNGTYTLKAWVRSSGGQTAAQMVAKHYGGRDLSAAIPATRTFTQISIPDIQVTDGRVEVAFYSVAGARKWIAFDDVTLEPAPS
ncbi:O-glycosyl hydrolase [Rathayibacter sp. PhB93]|uniref:glycoside hydrolase n=1 Tax=unclassified Rathayibacter TaxID=2609250 RepID=UPI000F49A0F6|nr:MULTISPECIES: glycoside hydrolase [unclassified Rathayibacter]ROQ04564.1 O-glycosyl hydrolase [Rathayibacter sp. PhB93]TDQ13402.1 O-glycosyl hydrolase [Rathayibacter sp. PhB1]